MILLTKFEELQLAVRSIVSESTAPLLLKDLEENGKNVSIDEVISSHSGLFTILPNGTIKKVVLYIAEQNDSSTSGYGLPKYHIYKCRTVQSMESSNRSFRYKISSRSDGIFRMTFTRRYSSSVNHKELDLEVCQNCLNIYQQQKHTAISKEQFRKVLQSFLNSMSTLDGTGFTYEWDLIPNQYSKDWAELSTNFKKIKEYTCEFCGWKASQFHKQYIHAHHTNGKVYENTIDNIKVLCIECHSEQPGIGHAKIKSSKELLEFKKIKTMA